MNVDLETQYSVPTKMSDHHRRRDLNTLRASYDVGETLRGFPWLKDTGCRRSESSIDQACLGAATVGNTHHLQPWASPAIPFN